MAKIRANGLEIEYDTFGDAGADPLLLIMGLGTQMIAWPPDLCEALAKAGHYVVRFDNRDIGLSSKFDGVRAPGVIRYAFHRLFGVPFAAPYNLNDMAADTIGVLDGLHIDRAHIVGASMGGMIAQIIATGHAHRVKTLTSMMSSSGDPRLPSARPEVTKHLFSRRPTVQDMEVMLEHTIKSAKLISSPGYPRSHEDWRAQISAGMQRSFYPQGYIRQLAAILADGSRVERLKTIDRPTLVIHGEADPLIPVECGIDTAKHIKNARLELIEGMGHDLPPPLVPTIADLIVDHTKANG